jgi:hypothetical protein
VVCANDTRVNVKPSRPASSVGLSGSVFTSRRNPDVIGLPVPLLLPLPLPL